jgi:hypothetical protein
LSQLRARKQEALTAVPGIGPRTAKELREVLGVVDAQGLLAAARDGRLLKIYGFGAKRVALIERLLGGAAEGAAQAACSEGPGALRARDELGAEAFGRHARHTAERDHQPVSPVRRELHLYRLSHVQLAGRAHEDAALGDVARVVELWNAAGRRGVLHEELRVASFVDAAIEMHVPS